MPLALAMNEPIVRSVFPRLPQRRRGQSCVIGDRGSCSIASWHKYLTLLPSSAHRNRIQRQELGRALPQQFMNDTGSF